MGPCYETGWEAISGRAEILVAKAKASRLESERSNLIYSRQFTAKRAYSNWKSNLGLAETAFLPSPHEVLLYPSFDALINQDGDEVIEEATFQGASAELAGWVEEWSTRSKGELLTIMVSGGATGFTSDPPSEADFIRLPLATTFFFTRHRQDHPEERRMHCMNILGLRQGRQQNRLSDLIYDCDAADLIARLITIAGLDPETCTADDMDNLNARFCCVSCPQGETHARSWRNCVSIVTVFVQKRMMITSCNPASDLSTG